MSNNRERQKKFRNLYSEIAERLGIDYMAAEDYAKTSADGIHIALESHEPFAKAIAEKAREILRRNN